MELKKLPACFYRTLNGTEPIRENSTSGFGIGPESNARDPIVTRTSKPARSKHLGSAFEQFLVEEGIASRVKTIAIKRALAWQLTRAMESAGMNKNQMAKAMNTSRSQLDRVLDPDNERIQLDTMIKAAEVVGRKLRIELI